MCLLDVHRLCHLSLILWKTSLEVSLCSLHHLTWLRVMWILIPVLHSSLYCLLGPIPWQVSQHEFFIAYLSVTLVGLHFWPSLVNSSLLRYLMLSLSAVLPSVGRVIVLSRPSLLPPKACQMYAQTMWFGQQSNQKPRTCWMVLFWSKTLMDVIVCVV